MALRKCARNLSYVKPEYQLKILKDLEESGEWSAPFIHSLILKAPEEMRTTRKRVKRSPWAGVNEQRKKLAQKLKQADRQYDFYVGLYRQYVADLLKLCIYVRKLLGRDRVVAFIEANHPEILKRFGEIVFEGQEKEALEQEEQPRKATSGRPCGTK